MQREPEPQSESDPDAGARERGRIARLLIQFLAALTPLLAERYRPAWVALIALVGAALALWFGAQVQTP